jgi:hypothetical protein
MKTAEAHNAQLTGTSYKIMSETVDALSKKFDCSVIVVSKDKRLKKLSILKKKPKKRKSRQVRELYAF